MQTTTFNSIEELSDIENPRNIASTIFSYYDVNQTGEIEMDSIVQMMKDCYKMIDRSFEPS